MNSILEDIYYGNWRPDESIRSINPKYRPINQKISESMKALKQNLPENEFKQIEELFELASKTSSMHAAAAFIHGFRKGALMMMEVVSGE